MFCCSCFGELRATSTNDEDKSKVKYQYTSTWDNILTKKQRLFEEKAKFFLLHHSLQNLHSKLIWNLNSELVWNGYGEFSGLILI